MPPSVISYQWQADDSAIPDATGSTYTLVAADEGKTIEVKVSFADDANNLETLTSAATAAVAAHPNSPPTGLPTISGTVQVGETLTADTSGIADQDGLDNATFSYQWRADDSAITDATGSTYTLTASEQGQTVQVRVSFTDDRNNAETLTSEATDTMEAAPVTTPLTASFQNVPASHDGQTSFIFELRLSEEPKSDFSYTTMRDHAFTVTGGSVTGARRLNPPSNTGWAVSVEPDSSGDVTVVLPLTTDCAAQGAICTGDGRKLSNRLEITVKGPPLTASFEIVPASHNGSDNFKFSIAFSEELETGFSYATLQDHAFTVEGGTAVGGPAAGQRQQHPVGGQRPPGLQRRRDDHPAHHHGLRRAGGHLRRRRQEAVQPPGSHRQRAGRIGRAPRAQRHRIRGCAREGQALLPGPGSRQALEGRQMPWSYSGIVREEDGTRVAVREVNADNQAEAWREIEDFCHRLSEVTGRKLEMDPGTFRCTGKAAGSGYGCTFFLTGG